MTHFGHTLTERLAIRPMARPDLDTAIGWAADEGWNPGLDDGDAFFAADPDGFLIAEIDSEPAACISAVNYRDRFGFIGFYICRPDLRGHGIGLKIWTAAMARLGEIPMGLDGVVDQQENYRKSGFEFCHNNLRYSGRPAVPAAPDPAIGDATLADLEHLIAFDHEFFPAPRQAFLRQWLAQRPTRRTAIYRAGDRIGGMGTIRTCRSGYKIGPLFADDAAIADRLIGALCRGTEGPVFLDVPAPNRAGVEIADRHGMEMVFQTARMYRGTPPELPLERIFGITTLELG